MNRDSKPEINARIQAEIIWWIKYQGEEAGQLENLFTSWWANRQKSRAYEREGRVVWKRRWVATVERLRREIAMRKNGRCPTCGGKMKTPRCLACDLKGKVAIERGGK
jgi:hypothetical protein